MIPRFKHSFSAAELLAAINIFSTNNLQKFETKFAIKFEVKYAVVFPYGRTALYLLLKAFGISGKEVICPAYTCIVVPHSIVYSGNAPVFVDNARDSFNMDLELAEKMISNNTKVIVATSLFGYPVNLYKLKEIKKRYPGILIIQDCCHCFNAKFEGESTHLFGDAAFFSLGISKIISAVNAGVVTTNDAVLAKKLRDLHLRNRSIINIIKHFIYYLELYPAFNNGYIYAFVNYLERHGFLDKLVKYYDDNTIDMPSDFLDSVPEFCCRIGMAQLDKLDNIIKIRRDIAKIYDKELSGISGILLPPSSDDAVYSHYVIRVKNRNELLEKARKSGLQLGSLIDYCIPEINVFKKYKTTQLPVASALKFETINLPVYSVKTAEKTVKILKNL